MHNYHHLLQDILDHGHTHEDRTGVGRRSVFGRDLRFDLSGGEFPLVTTRKVFVRGMIHETLMMLHGRTDAARVLEDQGVNIWKAWTPTAPDADVFAQKLATGSCMQNTPLDFQRRFSRAYSELSNADGKPPEAADCLKSMFASTVGTIGPMYGAIWRGNYDAGNGLKGPDQLADLIAALKTNPYGSRHTVTAQVPALLPLSGFSPKENVLLGLGALAPCHCYFQCFVSPALLGQTKLRLSLKIQIRSSDGPVGLPYNISQYALIAMVIAQCTGMTADELIVSIGDAHIYTDQIDLVRTQLERSPLPAPTLVLNPHKTDLADFTPEDFTLENYAFHPAIRYPVAT